MTSPHLWIALLRAVNVGGTGKIPMAALRERLTESGFTDVATYIQSGNIVLRAGAVDDEPVAVARVIKATIATEFGHDTDVLIRSAAQVRAVLEANPFGDVDPAKVGVLFCDGEVPAEAVDRMRAKASAAEQVVAARTELYVYYGDGMGRSRLGGVRLGVVATTRNLRTVAKLVQMSDG